MVSALVNGVKGGKWFSLIDKVSAPATLEAAWREGRGQQRGGGVDGQSVERFAAQADGICASCRQALRDGSYRPQPVRRVEIPKGDGADAAAGHPDGQGPHRADGDEAGDRADLRGDVRDRRATASGRGAAARTRCAKSIGCSKEGYTFVVDADLKSYFDTIPHERLMARVEDRISDGACSDADRRLPARRTS